MHDAERIYRLHQRLRDAKHPIAKARLAEELEVSPRTIQREVEFLRDRLGAPIQTTHRGYRYAPGADQFELPGLWFRADELHALLAASQLLESVQPGLLADHLQPLRNRIGALLEKSGHSPRTVGERILLKTAPRRSDAHHAFDPVAAATLTERPLRIRYHSRSRDQNTQRTVHPYRLLHYRDNWHLIGWCEQAGALRNFSLDRIEKIIPVDTAFRRHDPAALRAYLDSPFGIFSGEPKHRAVLRFTPERARWIADETWHPDQTSRWDGDHYVLSIPYANPTELILEIQRYGPDVEVLEPPELREAVARRVRETAEIYGRESR